MLDWIKNRVMERTSWDGGALLAVGLIVLFLGPFAKWASYASILCGILAIWKKED